MLTKFEVPSSSIQNYMNSLVDESERLKELYWKAYPVQKKSSVDEWSF